MQARIRVRHTPGAMHAYRANITGIGTYGWGNTPGEARRRIRENLEKLAEDGSVQCLYPVVDGSPQGGPCILPRHHRGLCLSASWTCR